MSVNQERQGGTYSKNRERLTDPVTRVKTDKTQNLESSSGGSSILLSVNKTTLTTLISLGVILGGGVIYASVKIVTHERQIEYLKENQKQQRSEFESLNNKNQTLERQIVELTTQFQNSRNTKKNE